jgi:hypothetical protein
MSQTSPPADYRPHPGISSKRRLIMTSVIAAAAVPTWSLLHAAEGTPSPLPPAIPSAAFLTVSQFLTGHASLDQGLARRLYKVFTAQDPAFTEHVQALADFIAKSTPTTDNLLTELQSNAPTLAKLPQALMQGWYLGIVGSGAKAQCVAYVDSLSNVATVAYVRPPSYSYGQYGSWAAQPV